MKEEILLEIRSLWDNHRKASIGVLLGLIFGICTLVFGFWSMVFVALCVGVGLFIGKKLDEGENISAKLCDYIKENWKRG